jgi:hypothetical protein
VSTTAPLHLIVVEPAARIAGARYPTMCGTLTEHVELTKAEQRARFICALCQSAQNLELVKAYEDLRARYNTHLTQAHLKESTDEQH